MNVRFVNMSKKIILSFIRSIDFLSEEEKKRKDYCVFMDDKKTLLLPEKNLLTCESNEILYLKQWIEEMIRNKRIQTELDFEYIDTPERNFVLYDDEILLVPK